VKQVFIGIALFVVTNEMAQTVARPEFEVASIRPNAEAHGPWDVVANNLLKAITNGSRNGQFRMKGAPLTFLIELAYNLKDVQVQGAPSWAKSDTYDIIAKAPSDTTFEQMRPMLQSLLADRFKLRLRLQTKELPVYELAVAKGGLKIEAVKEGSCVKFNPDSSPPPLPNPSNGRPPMTGFKDTFNANLEFAGAVAAGPPLGDQEISATISNASAPSIFTALQEQLGLKLESVRGPVEVHS
jgi:hypothetical protein